MRVLLDVSSLAREELTGIGAYIRSLAAELVRIDGIELRAVYRRRLHARRELIASHLPIAPSRYVPLVSTRGVELYHGPDFRLPRALALPSVVTVHDLAVFEDGLLDDEFARRGREKIRRLVERRRPRRVIAVSRFTADRLLDRFPSLEGRVDVVLLGYDPSVLRAGGSLPAEIDGPFVLYVGTIERRKNVTAVVEAFERVRANDDALRLVIAGGDGFDAAAVHERIERSPNRDAIIRLGFVSADVRAALLHAARVFIYPSLYEGFGLPVVEAMAAGCPVITSDSGAVAEVGATGALLVEPNSGAIADAVGRVVRDTALRTSLIAAGHARAAELTWERCARETAAVYRRVAGR